MPKVFSKRLFNQRGITLIELIAVILILGIIAAVGVPVVFNQIEKANVSADVTKMGIINDAIARYTLLNNNVGPVPAIDATEKTIDNLVATLAEKESGTDHIGGPYLDEDFDTSLKQAGKKWKLNPADGPVTNVEIVD